MKPTDEQYDLIDQYLQGELEGDELAQIETLMENDAEFAKAVEEERLLIVAIKRDAMIQRMENFENLGTGGADVGTGSATKFSIPTIPTLNVKEKLHKDEAPLPQWIHIYGTYKYYYLKYKFYWLAAASVILVLGVALYYWGFREETVVMQMRERAQSTEKNEERKSIRRNEEDKDWSVVSSPPEGMRERDRLKLPIIELGSAVDTSLGYAENMQTLQDKSTITVHIFYEKEGNREYEFYDSILVLYGNIDTTAEFAIIRLAQQDFLQLYLKINKDFYPISKAYKKLLPLKAETDKKILEQLQKKQ